MREVAKHGLADVCVIGTGAGGGVMLQELAEAGFDVVALERGPSLSLSQFMSDDELSVVLRDELFSPDQLETWRPDDASTAQVGRFHGIAHCLGGTMTHWAAWSWRFRPDEFKVLSTEGSVAGANLADFPFGYDELEPFYERAEWDFGVAGKAHSNPFEGLRKRGYPNPPHPPRMTSLRLARAAKKLGYSEFPVPMAINSRAYKGRPKCMYGGACQAYGCPIHAKATTFSVSIPRALATGRLDLRTNARATEIMVGKDGLARGVRYLDSTGSEREVRARQVIVAAGSIGTPHLMLSSTSNTFPQGIANSSGQLGRNLTYHHFPAVNLVFDEPALSFTGLEVHGGIDDLHPSDPKRGFIRGGVIADFNPILKQPIAYALMAHVGNQEAARGWGSPMMKYLSEFPRAATFGAICEDLPMEKNCVELDPVVRDAQGIPVPRTTHSYHSNDVAMFVWYRDKIDAIADAAGAVKRWPASAITLEGGASPAGSAHIHGTCRMGDDASKSVVDGFGRSHDVRNLWVLDCSVFPTAGGYNPTLTLLAMAYRTADHFKASGLRHEL